MWALFRSLWRVLLYSYQVLRDFRKVSKINLKMIWNQLKYQLLSGSTAIKKEFANYLKFLSGREVIQKFLGETIESFFDGIFSDIAFLENEVLVGKSQSLGSKYISSVSFVPYWESYLEGIFGDIIQLLEDTADDDEYIFDKTIDQVLEMDWDEYDAWSTQWEERIAESYKDKDLEAIVGVMKITFDKSNSQNKKTEYIKDITIDEYLQLVNYSGSQGNEYNKRWTRKYPVGTQRTWDASLYTSTLAIFDENEPLLIEQIQETQQLMLELEQEIRDDEEDEE